MHPQELACVLKTCEWSHHRVEWNRDGRLGAFVDVCSTTSGLLGTAIIPRALY